MIERDAKCPQVDACATAPVAPPAESAYVKQPLNDATLHALHKLVARGGVAGHAAQEMLDAELLGADDAYAARLRGRPAPPPPAPPAAWPSRLMTRLRAWCAKR